MSLTPGNTTAPIPLFNFDLPLPPRPDNPAPRGLRFPGNPDPRPYITDKEKSAFCKSPNLKSNVRKNTLLKVTQIFASLLF